jgi:hypothetical protein
MVTGRLDGRLAGRMEQFILNGSAQDEVELNWFVHLPARWSQENEVFHFFKHCKQPAWKSYMHGTP